jgi:hypothetical protein
MIEAELRAGNPDLQGLCLVLSDWSSELRLLQTKKSRRGETSAANTDVDDGAQPIE